MTDGGEEVGKWQVLSNPVNGEYVYQVVRIKNPMEPLHSGNIEITGTFDDEAMAEEYADAKNRLEALKNGELDAGR